MTNEEVNHYIISKLIPINFIWEDNVLYWLYIKNLKYNTRFFKKIIKLRNNIELTSDIFPIWKLDMDFHSSCRIDYKPTSLDLDYFQYSITDNNMKECLTEFFFWFELNKHRCKSIIYYND